MPLGRQAFRWLAYSKVLARRLLSFFACGTTPTVRDWTDIAFMPIIKRQGLLSKALPRAAPPRVGERPREPRRTPAPPGGAASSLCYHLCPKGRRVLYHGSWFRLSPKRPPRGRRRPLPPPPTKRLTAQCLATPQALFGTRWGQIDNGSPIGSTVVAVPLDLGFDPPIRPGKPVLQRGGGLPAQDLPNASVV